jgi:guanylate kinase
LSRKARVGAKRKPGDVRRRTNPARRARAFPIVISGPSGSGKTTLVSALVKQVPMLRRSVSLTTRPPREGEIDGEDYFFVDERRFQKSKRGKLVEWAEVHGYHYGTPKEFVEATLGKGIDVVLSIDVNGGRQIKKRFPDAVMIFILPPSLEVLEQRIRRRAADLAEDIKTRLDNARGELRALPEYDYVVVNDKLGPAIAALGAIVVSERFRRERYPRSFFEGFVRKAQKTAGEVQ